MASSLGSFIRSLSDADIDAFRSNGFIIVHGALRADVAESFYSEIVHAHSCEPRLTTPNEVQFLVSGGAIKVTKPNIFEADMHQAAVREHLPAFARLFRSGVRDVAAALNERMPELDMTVREEQEHASTFTIKAQVNEGGCFPWHYDNPSKPNKRRVTLAVYLTPNWQAQHGGELVVMPFLKRQTVVPPAFNTVVLFRSDAVMHRVLKATVTRYCFTVWMDSETTNADDDVNLRAKHLTPEFIPTLASTPLQRSISRAVYSEEYMRSAEECFGVGTRELKVSSLIHDNYVKPMTQSAALWRFVQEVRALRPAGDCSDEAARTVSRESRATLQCSSSD